MFERFTESARQVIVLAQQEALALKHNYIGTEHLLLGLLREEKGVAFRALESVGVTIDDARAQVGQIIGQGDAVASAQIPFTPRSKRVLELALQEALVLSHNYVGAEHILLGLVRENDGVAVRILLDYDADAGLIRDAVFDELKLAPPADYEPRMNRVALRRRATSSSVVLGVGEWPFERSRSNSLALGSLLFAVALGIGILIGWAIWG